MTTHRSTLLYHALALDLVVIATGVGYLFGGDELGLFAAFLVAIAAAAWKGGDEIGLAATAYSVVALVLFFPQSVDTTSLMAFAATGAVVASFARVARNIRRGELPAPRGRALETTPATPATAAAPFAIGLPLLAVVLYTDFSDLLMKNLPVPSMLQPLILLLVVAVWKYRHVARPLDAAVHPVIVVFGLYALAVFASSIWAREARLVDEAFSEVAKACIIAVVAASLASSWKSLERTLTVLVVAATVLAGTSVVQIATGKFFGAFGGLLVPETGNIYGAYASPRAAGPPATDPNAYARILLITIPLAVGLSIAHRRFGARVAFALAAAITTAGTIVTYSRGAMVALIGMAVLLLVAMQVNVKRVGLAVVAATIVLLLLPEAVTGRFGTMRGVLPGNVDGVEIDNSLEKRKLLVGASLGMFDDHPIGGVGAGNYSANFVQYAIRTGSPFMDYHVPGSLEQAHGLYFEAASETGLLGLITITLALLAAVFTSMRSRRLLLGRGDERHAALAMGLGIAVASYMIASLVLHESHLRYMGLYFGLIVAVARLTNAPPDEAAA